MKCFFQCEGRTGVIEGKPLRVELRINRGSANQTQAMLVEDKCNDHCANPVFVIEISIYFYLFIYYDILSDDNPREDKEVGHTVPYTCQCLQVNGQKNKFNIKKKSQL